MRSARAGKAAVTDIAGIAHFGAERRCERECDVEPVGRQKSGGAIGPFHQHHRAIGKIVEAEFGKLGRAGEPIEIGMDDRETRQLIGLYQREGRTRHVDRLVAGEVADQRAREGRFAGAEIARERDEVARFEHRGDVDHESPRRFFIRQGYREACATRGGQKHGELRYSAAVSEAVSLSGNVHVTVVPCPTADEIDTVPPCNSTKERTSERPIPGPRCCEPSECVSNQSKTFSSTSGGIPGPRSETENMTASALRRRGV